MADIRLAKLPDRTPVRLTISVSSQLNRALHDYATAYEQSYGQAETVSDLIPFMLEAFLDSDRSFSRTKAKS